MAAPAVAGVGIASSIFGAITSAFGAEATGQAQQKTDQFLSQQALYNSQVAKQNEAFAREQGELSAGRYGIGASSRLGQIKASQASSGIDVNSGSALQIQKSQQMVTDIDLDQIRSNAAKTAYNFSVESVQDQNQAKLYTMAGSNAAAAGSINAQASLISGAGSVASKWLAANQVGTLSGAGAYLNSLSSDLGF
jgi:hypothetical protein